MSEVPLAENDGIAEARRKIARALHEYVCGTDYDEWNAVCSWAGDDVEPSLKTHAVCADVPVMEWDEPILRLLADAWDEGMRTGTSRAMRKMSDEPDLPLASASDNPYSPESQPAHPGGDQ